MKTFLCLLISTLILSDLTAQGWTHQNPSHEIGDLYDIDFSGPHGLVVGQLNLLFITHDAGATWQRRHTDLLQSLCLAAFVAPGTNGQVMLAAAERVVISRDGGDTWSLIDDRLKYVFKIQSTANGDWIALGYSDAFRSDDQGETWEKIPYGWAAEAGHFTSSTNGWVEKRIMSGAYQIWVTTDGGMNWILRDPTVYSNIDNIVMVNDSVGFFSSAQDIYKTVNGGNNWVKQITGFLHPITDLYAVNENEVWASSASGEVLYTLDGGIEWKSYDPKLIYRKGAWGICADNQGQVWMCGKYVTVLHSNDFGKHWINQIPIGKHNLYCIDFLNKSIGVAGGATGTFLKTLDGGAHWQTVSFPFMDTIYAIDMVDSQTIVAGTSLGKVFYSTDQGTTWDNIGSGFEKINGIQALDTQTFILVTDDGKIYKTENSGNQWNLVYENEGYPLKDLEFIDSLTGYAAGWSGQILKTINAGDSWLPVINPGKGNFSAMTFTSALEGYVVSSRATDSLWHTMDGGLSWEIIHIFPYWRWTGINFTNPDTGWIAGGNPLDGFGFVNRTNNHGVTWEYDHETYDEISGMTGVPGTENIWTIGFGGHIDNYSPCLGTPLLNNLNGSNHPCAGDTIAYSVTANSIDNYQWSIPFDWEIYGNKDSSSILVVVGLLSGQIEVTGSNVCNAFSTQAMEVEPVDTTAILITENNGVVSTEQSAGYYQWLLNGIEIPGATQSTYTPLVSGMYELLYSKFENGCVVLSNTLNITISSIVDSRNDEIQIFPIPAKTEIFIKNNSKGIELQNAEVSVYSPAGVMVLHSQLNNDRLDLSGLAKGFYFLILQNESLFIIRKIVIQ